MSIMRMFGFLAGAATVATSSAAAAAARKRDIEVYTHAHGGTSLFHFGCEALAFEAAKGDRAWLGRAERTTSAY